MKKKTYDEIFKNRIKKFFEKFAIVKTEYEILRLPRKVDILIIEASEPIQDHVLLFTYFKKYNIIEFKSEEDRFRTSDMYKIGYYINGVLLKEKSANIENSTFTLVSTYKPRLLFKNFQTEKLINGLYRIRGMNIIDVYVVVNEELEQKFEKDYAILKTFTSKKDRESVIIRAIESEPEESLEDLFLLYGEEIGKIFKRLGKDMTAVQERIVELADKFGVRERIAKKEYEKGREEGFEKGRRLERKKAIKTAIRLKKAGLEVDFIADMVELPKPWLEKFFLKIKI